MCCNQKYVGIGLIEWEPPSVKCGYGISTSYLQQAAPVSVSGECFYQGFQIHLPPGQPEWRIIVTSDSLLSTNNLPLKYYGCFIDWISNPRPRKICGPKKAGNLDILGYSRQAPYLRISDEISGILHFPFRNPVQVNIYVATLNNDTLIILEPS